MQKYLSLHGSLFQRPSCETIVSPKHGRVTGTKQSSRWNTTRSETSPRSHNEKHGHVADTKQPNQRRKFWLRTITQPRILQASGVRGKTAVFNLSHFFSPVPFQNYREQWMKCEPRSLIRALPRHIFIPAIVNKSAHQQTRPFARNGNTDLSPPRGILFHVFSPIIYQVCD